MVAKKRKKPVGSYPCSDGTKVRSQHERDVYENILLTGQTVPYEPKSFPYVVFTHHYYTPDLVLPGGVWVELKGYFRRADIAKMSHVRKSHPNQVIGLLLQKPGKIPQRKMTIEQWCARNGFLYADGTHIPTEWYTMDGIAHKLTS